MTSRVQLAWSVLALATLPACSKSSGSDGAEHHHEPTPPPAGTALNIGLDGKSVSVDLRTLAGEGGTAVPLAQIVAAAFPAENPAQLHFDLVGSDGFRPTSRPKCPHLLTGDDIAHFSLNVMTHDVTTDDKISLPGCYHVKAVVLVDATR